MLRASSRHLFARTTTGKGTGSAIGRRRMIADIHSSFGYMRFRNHIRRPGFTSVHRKKFAVGIRSFPSPQGGGEDSLRAPKPQAIVFRASFFFCANSSARTLSKCCSARRMSSAASQREHVPRRATYRPTQHVWSRRGGAITRITRMILRGGRNNVACRNADHFDWGVMKSAWLSITNFGVISKLESALEAKLL